jgi:hypothetical protein
MLSALISRIRRNHGLEHASIHVLSEKHHNFSAQGHSNHNGFSLNIYGDISEQEVTAAVEEAYRRLKDGEQELAIHPNCGTALLTSAAMAAIAAQATFALEQRRQRQPRFNVSVLFNALPGAILATAVALILARPLGLYLQAQFTVEGDLGGLKLVSIEEVRPSPVTRFFQLLLTPGKKLEARSYKVRTVD